MEGKARGHQGYSETVGKGSGSLPRRLLLLADGEEEKTTDDAGVRAIKGQSAPAWTRQDATWSARSRGPG